MQKPRQPAADHERTFSPATKLVQGKLHAVLSGTAAQPPISPLGYTVGFLIVVFGRQQLFTENTLTPILPLLWPGHARDWTFLTSCFLRAGLPSTMLAAGHLLRFGLRTYGGVVFAANVGEIDSRWRQFQAHLVHCVGDDLRDRQVAKPFMV